MRTSASYGRAQVFERDGGVCCLCDMDTEALRKRLAQLQESDPERYLMEREMHCIPDHRVTLWDMDHILPVVEGGGECGLENLRTLCLWCHAEVTASLNEKRHG